MRYFIGFFATILLIILLIVLLVHGGGKPKQQPTTKALDSYAATNSEVSLTIDGPINAVSLHEQVRITIDRDNATYEHIRGYSGQAVEMQRFPNTQDAYENLLFALERVGFTQGDTVSGLKDERGYCATGARYVFELKDSDKTVERYWSSTCGTPKTYLGQTGETVDLFKAQIPGYSEITANVEVSG
jgi:hypothetical protein